MKQPIKTDVVVVGGGHAGVEASNIISKLGIKNILVTMDLSAIGRMSCNPAVGGLAKGQLVREIDLLGGAMALHWRQTRPRAGRQAMTIVVVLAVF